MTNFIVCGRAVNNHLEQADGSIQHRPGGSGFIQAEAMQRMSPHSKVWLMTDLGNDAEGDAFAKLLSDSNVLLPTRISRTDAELPSLYAFWPHGAKVHDLGKSYLDSVPIEISALPKQQLELDGPSFLVMASQGTTLELQRYLSILEQAREQNAVVVVLPNSRPIDPALAPEKFRANRDNLKLQFAAANIIQFSDKDVPNMFGETYGYRAMQTIRAYSPSSWIIVTRGASATEIFRPQQISPDFYVGVPAIPGLPETFNKTDGGTIFGARMLAELDRAGLHAPEALYSDNPKADPVSVKIVQAVAAGNYEASRLIAQQNGIHPGLVKASRLMPAPA